MIHHIFVYFWTWITCKTTKLVPVPSCCSLAPVTALTVTRETFLALLKTFLKSGFLSYQVQKDIFWLGSCWVKEFLLYTWIKIKFHFSRNHIQEECPKPRVVPSPESPWMPTLIFWWFAARNANSITFMKMFPFPSSLRSVPANGR